MSMCKKPFTGKGLPFGCGQCMHCRYNRKRTWTARVMLESKVHARNSFITLTYDDQICQKKNYVPWSLDHAHFPAFIKRLRDRLPPESVRYFGVGEYGDTYERPHFHSALFGIGCDDPNPDVRLRKKCCCFTCKLIRETWGWGATDVATLEYESAAYVAGYVTKKMTNPKDPKVQAWLKGRKAEKSHMSRNPGIGANSLTEIAIALSSEYGEQLIQQTGDVPMQINTDGRSMPLGRYLRQKLREELGYGDALREQALTKYKLENYEKTMLLREEAKAEGKTSCELYKKIKEERFQKIENFEKRQKIMKSRKGVL